MTEKVMVFNILRSLKNHLILISGIALICMIISWSLLAFVLAPQYEATSQIFIEQESANTPDGTQVDTIADHQTVNTYIAMVKSRDVLSKVTTATGIDMTPTELFEKVSVANATSSQVINITVKDKDGALAGEIANSLADATVLESWVQMKARNLSVITKASPEEVPFYLKENILYALAIGGLFGIVVGVLIAFISELFNMLFKTGVLKRKRKRSNLQTVFK